MKYKNYSTLSLIIFLFTMLLIIPSGSAQADSSYIDLSIEGTTRDIGVGQISLEGGFSVNSGAAHYWAGATYYTVDLATEAITSMGAPGDVLSNGYGDPFGMYDDATNTFYAATYYDEGSSYVYKYDCNNGTWSDAYSAVNIYGGDFSNGDLYISGLREPWSGGYDTTFISLFDFSGNDLHDAIVEVGGASSHMAVDNDGNIYYAPYSWSNAALYMWTAEQVASVTNDNLAGGEEDTYLSLDDGLILTELAGLSNGITVDDAGNVFVSLNCFDGSSTDSAVVMWDGTVGEDENYDVIATNAEGSYGWFGGLAIEGDFTKGDSLYGSFTYGGPITEITSEVSAVPIPGAVWLLGSGLLGIIGIRRRSYN